MTTLGELRNKFSAVHKQYNSTAFELSKKLNETKELIKRVPEGDKLFGEQAAVLELQYNAVKDQQKIYDDFIHQFMDKWDAEREMVSAKQMPKQKGIIIRKWVKFLRWQCACSTGISFPARTRKNSWNSTVICIRWRKMHR